MQTTPPTDKAMPMFVAYLMDPLVERYRKIFDDETINNTALLREGQIKIREKLKKFLPIEDGILRMVVDHLPSPDQA